MRFEAFDLENFGSDYIRCYLRLYLLSGSAHTYEAPY